MLPIYIAGLFLTPSSPSRTLISSAEYLFLSSAIIFRVFQSLFVPFYTTKRERVFKKLSHVLSSTNAFLACFLHEFCLLVVNRKNPKLGCSAFPLQVSVHTIAQISKAILILIQNSESCLFLRICPLSFLSGHLKILPALA